MGIISSQIAQNNPSIENNFSVCATPSLERLSPSLPASPSLSLSDRLPLSHTAFKELLLLKEDRDLSSCELTERSIDYYKLRLGVGDSAIRSGFKELEERGYAGSAKGKGKNHVTQRWITEKGYLWLVNQTDDVTDDVILSTPYRSLIQRK